MNHRILVIGFFTEWVTHLGTELELCQRGLDENAEVHVLMCDGGIGGCRVNPLGLARDCRLCLYRRIRGHQMLLGGVHEHYISDYINCNFDAKASCSQVVSADQAKGFCHEGAELGWGALSSAIDLLRDPDGRDARFAEILPRLTKSAVLAYEATCSFLRTQAAFDAVYIFNGRFESTLGARLAVMKDGRSRLMLHERGANIGKYAVFDDGKLHSRSAISTRIQQHWDRAADIKAAVKDGEVFFRKRRHGLAEDWWSFVSQQRVDAMPTSWSTRVKNIVIFNSSEDEWAAVGDEWSNNVYGRQSLGIEQIVLDVGRLSPESMIYLRMHPNLKGVQNADVDRIHRIRSPNFCLISPESEISSYALMEAADVVLTFGSTMGIEAAYWGKSSILAGPAEYENLGSVHVMSSHEQVIDALLAIPAPLDNLGAIKYGYYRQTLGDDFRYWRASGFIDGVFSGHSLHPRGTAFSGFLIRISRLLSSQSALVRLLSRLADIPGRASSLFQRRRAGSTTATGRADR